MKRPKTLPTPAATEQWRERLKSSSMKLGFQLSLSKSMLEFLCAVSDGVMWDRHLYSSLHCADNWIASEGSLIKRGLIERHGPEFFEARKHDDHAPGEFACCKLTPAGALVVELLKMAGLFVEADAAINKKARRA